MATILKQFARKKRGPFRRNVLRDSFYLCRRFAEEDEAKAVSAYLQVRDDNGSLTNYFPLLRYKAFHNASISEIDLELFYGMKRNYKQEEKIREEFRERLYRLWKSPGWKKYKEIAIEAYDRWEAS